MEDRFHHHHVPEEEKPVIAEETLTEDAFVYWNLDANIRLDYGVPDASWREMKEILMKNL